MGCVQVCGAFGDTPKPWRPHRLHALFQRDNVVGTTQLRKLESKTLGWSVLAIR